MSEVLKSEAVAAKTSTAIAQQEAKETRKKVSILEREVAAAKQLTLQAQEVTLATAPKLQNHVIEETERRRAGERQQREAAGVKVVGDS